MAMVERRSSVQARHEEELQDFGSCPSRPSEASPLIEHCGARRPRDLSLLVALSLARPRVPWRGGSAFGLAF
eukprot:7382675-Prymnesium_polylepis.2